MARDQEPMDQAPPSPRAPRPASAALLARKLRPDAGPQYEIDRLIGRMTLHRETAPAGQLVVVEGKPVRSCCLLVAGFAFRSKITEQGGRQIVSLHMPGDFIDLQHLLMARADHSIEAAAPIEFIRVPKPQLRELVDRHPRIGFVLWHDTLLEGARFREWMLNIGRRDALARVAHLLCEFAVRTLDSAAPPDELIFPMTQAQIADATGLTPVHVNRVLRRLAEGGAIGARRPHLAIVDIDRLAAIAGFDPGYLHLDDRLDGN